MADTVQEKALALVSEVNETKVLVRTSGATLTSSDFGPQKEFDHRLIFSPDRIHSIFINFLGNGVYIVTNNSKINFQFSIGRDGRTMASIEYKSGKIFVNNQWEISKKFVSNTALAANPDIRRSRLLNFDIGAGRMDIKFEGMEYVSMFFNDRELYSVRFDGDDAEDEFNDFVTKECIRKPLTTERVEVFLNEHSEIKVEIVRKFTTDWLAAHSNNEGDPDYRSLIARFIQTLGLEIRIGADAHN